MSTMTDKAADLVYYKRSLEEIEQLLRVHKPMRAKSLVSTLISILEVSIELERNEGEDV